MYKELFSSSKFVLRCNLEFTTRSWNISCCNSSGEKKQASGVSCETKLTTADEIKSLLLHLSSIYKLKSTTYSRVRAFKKLAWAEILVLNPYYYKSP